MRSRRASQEAKHAKEANRWHCDCCLLTITR